MAFRDFSFRKLGGLIGDWISRLRGGGSPVSAPPPEDPDGRPIIDLTEDLELHDFQGASEDVAWMTYNHATWEMMIQFLEHGQPTGGLYSYPDVLYTEFCTVRDGFGPFPRGRDPHYLKPVSTGQKVNYWLRNDQQDDFIPYTRIR